MNTTDMKIEKHIAVLDGVRVFAMFFVVWFHFWQQSWLTPRITFSSPVANYLGITGINIEGFVRYGFVFVDMLILLSAFCNFYPYARSLLLGEPWQRTRTFYKKRALRILPSYYLCLLINALILILEGRCRFDAYFWKDTLTHIFCIAPLFPDTYLSGHFTGVLWTVQIEVLYYILLPLLARLFRRAPIFTCLALWSCGILSANYILCEQADNIRVYGNHFLTFAGCYANGMLLCVLYITLRKRITENKYTRLAAAFVLLCCIFHLNGMLKQFGAGELQVVQLGQRFELSLTFSVFLLALPFSCRTIQMLFANKLMTFLAGISYNLYLWHQYIAVKLKEYHIPYWTGDLPPNQTGDKVWMWKYQILIVAVSLLTAVVITYGFEKPVSRKVKF